MKTARNALFPAVFAIFIHFSGDRACIKDYVFIDPACGTSGFLVAAGEYLKTNCREAIFFDQQAKEHYMTKMFTGYDMDRTMLRIGAMNMMTHGVENPVIAYRDSLSDQNPDRDAYSLILANEAVICGLTPEKACNIKEFAA